MVATKLWPPTRMRTPVHTLSTVADLLLWISSRESCGHSPNAEIPCRKSTFLLWRSPQFSPLSRHSGHRRCILSVGYHAPSSYLGEWFCHGRCYALPPWVQFQFLVQFEQHLTDVSRVFEATLAPGLLLITSNYYTQREQPARFGMWTLLNGLLPIPFLVIVSAQSDQVSLLLRRSSTCSTMVSVKFLAGPSFRGKSSSSLSD